MTLALASATLSPEALGRLRWRCRRGLLENDLLLQRFFARHPQGLSQAQAQGLERLMDLSDPDLLDLFLGRREPAGDLDLPAVRAVIQAVRPNASAV